MGIGTHTMETTSSLLYKVGVSSSNPSSKHGNRDKEKDGSLE